MPFAGVLLLPGCYHFTGDTVEAVYRQDVVCTLQHVLQVFNGHALRPDRTLAVSANWDPGHCIFGYSYRYKQYSLMLSW
jgi:hypothetical protein